MHREDDIDVINAKIALKRICENNTKFVFEIDDYDSTIMALAGEKHSGKGGIIFHYCSNGMSMGVSIGTSDKQLSFGTILTEKKESHWYYEEYQRLYKILENTFKQLNK